MGTRKFPVVTCKDRKSNGEVGTEIGQPHTGRVVKVLTYLCADKYTSLCVSSIIIYHYLP